MLPEPVDPSKGEDGKYGAWPLSGEIDVSRMKSRMTPY
jgi:hypothetical protein